MERGGRKEEGRKKSKERGNKKKKAWKEVVRESKYGERKGNLECVKKVNGKKKWRKKG